MNKKNKIFLFNPYPSTGGADTTIHRFTNSINLKKFDVEYLSLRKVKYNLIKNVTYTKINSTSTFLSFFKILKIVKNDKHKNKIFISLQYFANVWSIIFIKLILRIKTFIYEINHLNELNYYKNFIEFVKKKIIKFLVKKLYINSDIIAGNSKELSKDLQKYVNKKVYTIYNPCFENIKKRKKKYLTKQNINLLSIARFEDQKDHFTLLKAIKYSKIKDKINLLLVGFGSRENEIRKYIKHNKLRVKIFTNLKKLDFFYNKSDLFVSTSLYEGLPTTMIEAASYRLPIISSNFKSGSAEILSNGKSGFLFKLRDYKKLSKLIEDFYNNPKIFLQKEKNCRRNLNRFSVKKNTKLFNHLVQSLI